MKNNPRLNGSDYLMLGFDHELRRRGFAGNSSQIVLELDSAPAPALLQSRLDVLLREIPLFNARASGLLSPRWKIPRRAAGAARVRVHRDEPGLPGKIFNESLACRRGEQVRFDLIERAGGRTSVVFTWAHALMDAPAAEHLLAAVSDQKVPLPTDSPPPPKSEPQTWRQKLDFLQKTIRQLDEFCEAAPRSMSPRHHGAPRALHYRVEKFSADDTARVRANSVRQCGVLGDAQFHAAVAALELHALHERLSSPSPSYIVPIPVSLRPKGKGGTFLGNHLDMLMLQFLPKHLGSIGDAVAALKSQAAQAVRDNSLSNSRRLSEMFSFLPLPLYMVLLKHGLRGEICSLFFGDTAAVNPLLNTFLGATVEDFTHVAAVTPAPGLGLIFYYFRGQLRLTVVHAATLLNDAEAADFAARLRARLLNP